MVCITCIICGNVLKTREVCLDTSQGTPSKEDLTCIKTPGDYLLFTLKFPARPAWMPIWVGPVEYYPYSPEGADLYICYSNGIVETGWSVPPGQWHFLRHKVGVGIHFE